MPHRRASSFARSGSPGDSSPSVMARRSRRTTHSVFEDGPPRTPSCAPGLTLVIFTRRAEGPPVRSEELRLEEVDLAATSLLLRHLVHGAGCHDVLQPGADRFE